MVVYLDNAATTKIDKRVLSEMNKYYTNRYGNASSIHFMGQKNNLALESSKEKVAKILNAETDEIIFTAGASESNNFLIKGIMKANRDKGDHVIVSQIEHPCVMKAVADLSDEVFKISIAPVNIKGIVDIKKLEKMITKKTVLVSIMTVNNEIGVIQDIDKISKLAHKKGALFHTDAVQAVPYLKLDVKRSGIDALSLSAHKFNGPKGMGLAYIKKGVKVKALISGGGQENSLRAGTYNLPGIIGMTKALELGYKERTKTVKNIKSLRDYFWKRIQKEIEDVKLNGDDKKRTPNNLNIMFKNIEGEAILIELSEQGICVSTGSACSSNSLKSSYVLKSLKLDKNFLNSNIRFTLGKYNTKKEIDYTINVLKKTCKRLRSFSPVK